ncbi:hypothetical protein GCM10009813_27630 [Brevibacterium marinum]
MRRLLEYAEDGDTVVVWRIDRLGRSLLDVLATVNLLRDRGLKVCSVSDNIDPETSSSRMMLGMLATLAEYERELIAERVNAGIAAAKQNGTKFGRPPVDPDDIAQKLSDDPLRPPRHFRDPSLRTRHPHLRGHRPDEYLHGRLPAHQETRM